MCVCVCLCVCLCVYIYNNIKMKSLIHEFLSLQITIQLLDIVVINCANNVLKISDKRQIKYKKPLDKVLI